jgi:hypothetical protein
VTGRGQRQRHPSKTCPHWPTSSNQAPSPNSPFSYELMNGLIHTDHH